MTGLTLQDWHRRYRQQARWTRELRSHLLPRAGLGEARRALEVGCGTGAILAELIPQTPAQVHGLDLEAAPLSLAHQEAEAALLTQGDAHQLPYPEGAFDLTLCHFLLLWVAEPAQALAEMVRVTRQGGCLLALAEPDYGGRIDYPDSLAALGTKQETALLAQGADPRLGRRLRALFARAGLKNVECGVLGGQWQTPPLKTDIDSEWQVVESDLGGRLPEAEFYRLKREDAAAWARGERVLYVPTFYAIGWRPKV